jgi:hypothetical protein
MSQITIGNFANARIGFEIDTLMEIHQPKVNIAIHQRDISHLQSEIKNFLDIAQENFQSSGNINQLEITLIEYFEKLGYNANSLLLKDVLGILKVFTQVTEYNEFKILLSIVNSDMCRRFHTDMNHLRLLCTYSGPATLWIPEDKVNRSALQFLKENNDIIKNPEHIQQVATGDICILKGALYPHPDTRAIVHRSPAVEETGSQRLLLRIDTNDSLI